MIPKGIVTTGWPSIKARGAELGFHYDPWQDGAGQITFGKRKDGKYAASIGGVVWSIPRQIGKTFSVGSWVMVLCILFPGLKVVWTAHRLRTSTMTFRSMQGMARRPKIAPHIRHIRTANGEQEIAFANGSVILFGAREQGFGRGFEEVDVEVFDEAQILTEKALDDMVPATNQARHPHGALLFFIGTPPKDSDPGEAFTSRRRKALSGKSKDMVYVEFSADQGADPDDRKQWSKANPSFPKRTPLESMLRMRENLLSDEAWMREALGMWTDYGTSGLFSLAGWTDLANEKADVEGGFLFGIDMTPERSYTSIGLAGTWQGKTFVDLGPHQPGTRWVIGACQGLRVQHPDAKFAIDENGPAASLIPELEDVGIPLLKLNTQACKRACGWFYDEVTAGNVAHLNNPQLNAAVAGATKRDVGEAWLYDRKKSAVISPLVAVTWAAWSLANNGPSVYEERGVLIL